MRIIKVSNVEKFAAKILPKQPQNNKTIVESILKDVKKMAILQLKNTKKSSARQTFLHYVYLKMKLKMHTLKSQKLN